MANGKLCTECHLQLTQQPYATCLYDERKKSYNIHIHLSCLMEAKQMGMYPKLNV